LKNKEGESIIMDLNPNNFEKPKDHLFFDFFSIYAKSFIKNKSENDNNNNGLVLLKTSKNEE
jgi:hypothetical protein